MIPKIIHYCWFGGNPLPESAKKCIDSWKKYCPNYEIREWNETNYDLSSNHYMEEAYSRKIWGFVPDYARLDIVYQHGGIYMDVDVEVVRSMDELLNNAFYMGIEKSASGSTSERCCREWHVTKILYYPVKKLSMSMLYKSFDHR